MVSYWKTRGVDVGKATSGRPAISHIPSNQSGHASWGGQAPPISHRRGKGQQPILLAPLAGPLLATPWILTPCRGFSRRSQACRFEPSQGESVMGGGGSSAPLSQEPDWCFPCMKEPKLPISSWSHCNAYSNFCPAKNREIVRDTIRGVALRWKNTPTNFPEIWTVPPPYWRPRGIILPISPKAFQKQPFQLLRLTADCKVNMGKCRAQGTWGSLLTHPWTACC